MQLIKLLLIITIIAFLGCKEGENIPYAEFEKEIKALDTDAKKQAYLEKILVDDQKVRDNKDADLMLKYGKDSKEHMEYVKRQWKMDKINLWKVEKYMELYGYPGKALGEEATTAPWMVIHHSQGLDARYRNFQTLYEAYLKGELTGDDLTFFLGRMHDKKHGHRLHIENPYTTEEQIDRLIKALDLEEKRANALSSLRQKEQSDNHQ